MQIEALGDVGETQERTFVRALADSVTSGDGGGELDDCTAEHAVKEAARIVGVLGNAFAGEVFGQGQDAEAASGGDL